MFLLTAGQTAGEQAEQVLQRDGLGEHRGNQKKNASGENTAYVWICSRSQTGKRQRHLPPRSPTNHLKRWKSKESTLSAQPSLSHGNLIALATVRKMIEKLSNWVQQNKCTTPISLPGQPYNSWTAATRERTAAGALADRFSVRSTANADRISPLYSGDDTYRSVRLY